MKEMNLRNYAYIGDAVWELFIREKTVKLTENAKKELDAFFADKEKSTIRVFLAPGG